MEQLEQKAVAGLAHVSDILFIPKSEDDAAVNNLVREIEAVLDTLINEREKQIQQQQGGTAGVGGRDSASSVIGETHTNRSPELDFAIAKYDSPKVRLPRQLPSRPHGDEMSVNAHVQRNVTMEDEENEEEGPWERNFVKTASLQSLRNTLKKSAKSLKAEKGVPSSPDKAALSATM
eukprot:scaffold7012_cov166-Ochromonas_danica.AAC.2